MTKPILLVTSRYTKDIEDRIDRDFNARQNPNQFPFSQQVLSAAEGAEADRLDSGFFQKASPTIKIIATYSVGFEHIDLEAAARRKISVAYTPGVNHEATADIAMLLYLVLRVALTGPRNWFEQELGGPAARRLTPGHLAPC
jgi:lactate dehydrogenase-like 2-hydroxyacid dehydrogenase